MTYDPKLDYFNLFPIRKLLLFKEMLNLFLVRRKSRVLFISRSYSSKKKSKNFQLKIQTNSLQNHFAFKKYIEMMHVESKR